MNDSLGALFDASAAKESKISTVDARMGASSPGGTKEIRLKVGFDSEAWKQQLRKEADDAKREDALADRLQAGSGLSKSTAVYSPSSQMTMEMRGDMMEEGDDGGGSDDTDAIRRKYGMPSGTSSPIPRRRTTNSSGSNGNGLNGPNGGGDSSGKVGEKFEGSFDWGEQNFDQVQQLSA